ncbi:site-2 protease family protein [Bacillus sp. BRMEA1]|uniref:site-2 protease family protein n=1 Tax=Neobacillus endophyticus TaxID=2738405 RepID=UPI0015637456|nr:site-2 protease family protein [Neobacillus endophyticus]NRD77121.1 site-2 protease family protein [Neobacillus endophyticus]
MKNRNIKTGGKKTPLGILAAFGALLLGKFKFVFIILKFLKLHTLVSLVIYLGTYAYIYGWKFAVALVYLLFVHEMGHVYAAKRIKLPVSSAIFIPFIGAAVALKELPKSAKDESFVAYMGPLFGLISFLPAIPLYLYTHEPFWAIVIILGGLLNLFNLIPITPLDGGRIAAGISTKLWGLGIVLLLAFSIKYLSFMGFIIVILGSTQWYRIYKKQKRLHDDQQKVQELEQLIIKLKQAAHDLDALQEMVKTAPCKEANQEMTKLFNTLNLEIEKRKKDLYLQQLSGAQTWGEEEGHNHQQVFESIIHQLEEKCSDFKKDVQRTETYYKTSKKTKVQLFLIYIGLVAALSISYYYGNEILLNHPEIRNAMHK